MGRPKGSKNKPKPPASLIAVKLEDLNKVFKQDAIILVDERYSTLISPEPSNKQPQDQEEKVEFEILNP